MVSCLSDIPSFVSYSMNAPNRYELYVLDEGEKPYVAFAHAAWGIFTSGSIHFRVEVTEDTKIPNAATVKIVKQDHTLGNMIRGCVTFYLRDAFASTPLFRPQPTSRHATGSLRWL
jgi:hypothetical protein